MRERMLWNAENAITNKTVKWIINTRWLSKKHLRILISSQTTISVYVIINPIRKYINSAKCQTTDNWNTGWRSLKINQTGTTRKHGCGILFAFHSRPNYGSVLHHFRDKARYWSKIVTPPAGGARRNIAIPFGVKKTRMMGLPDGEKKL